MATRHVLFGLRLQLDRLQPRERLLLLAVVVLILALLTQAVLWTTGLADHEPRQTRIENLRTEHAANQNALLTLKQALNNPRIHALNERNTRLRDELQELNNRINRVTDVLIPPKTMVTLLRELLAGNALTLTSLRVEPAVPVKPGDSDTVTLYRHRMVLELTGNFTALEGYLKSIESLPWQLFWDELSVETEDYPTLRIRLRVHTLSDQEVWLNV